MRNIFCWSDSEISLFWIRSIEKEWRQWLENRVILFEILQIIRVDIMFLRK